MKPDWIFEEPKVAAQFAASLAAASSARRPARQPPAGAAAAADNGIEMIRTKSAEQRRHAAAAARVAAAEAGRLAATERELTAVVGQIAKAEETGGGAGLLGGAGETGGAAAMAAPAGRAFVLHRDGDAAGCRVVCRLVLAEDPTHSQALRHAGWAAAALEDWAEAAELLERALVRCSRARVVHLSSAAIPIAAR